MSGHVQHSADCARVPGPCLGFQVELLLARSREPVESRSTAKFRNSPLRRNPALMFQTMESGIKRALVDAQYVQGSLLNPLRDCPPMHSAQLQGSEDEKVEGALQHIHFGALAHGVDSRHQRTAHWCRMSTTILANINRGA